MCGRFTQQLTWSELHALYALATLRESFEVQPRYNGAPTQQFAVCRVDNDGGKEIASLRWGLVPFWAQDRKIGSKLTNARAETAHSKPSFRAAFRARRCLIPANGWFEWSRVGSRKQPYFIASADEEPVSFAGLWETWDKDDEPIETFTIITTEASPELAEVHHRQPAIIAPNQVDEWLDPAVSQPRLRSLANDSKGGPFRYHSVSTLVNNVRNDTPEILEPLSEQGLLGSL